MDTITQALLGAAIAEAGWRGRLGWRGILFGTTCGLLPDADVISSLWGPWASITHHRGITHSLIFAPLVAPLLGFLAHKYTKASTTRDWAWLAFFGLITHPLLDVFTSYGTQLLFPFTTQRFALDGVSIIDPIYSLPLLFALLIGLAWRERPEVGAWATRITLGLTTAYLAFGYTQSLKAEDALRAALTKDAKDANIEEVRAMPTFGNSGLWRVVARDSEGGFYIGYHSTYHPTPVDALFLPPLKDNSVALFEATDIGQLFKWFSMEMVSYRIEPSPGGHTVIIAEDQRYGSVMDPTRPLWWVRATMTPEGDIIEADYIRGPGRKMNMSAELGRTRDWLFEGVPYPHPEDP